MKRTPTAEELRAEAEHLKERADRIEQEQKNHATAHQVPTCPNCAERGFLITSYAIEHEVTVFFSDDEDCYDSANQKGIPPPASDEEPFITAAVCVHCGTDVRRVLERHGFTKFYGEPVALEPLDFTNPDPNDPPPAGTFQAERRLRLVRGQKDQGGTSGDGS